MLKLTGDLTTYSPLLALYVVHVSIVTGKTVLKLPKDVGKGFPLYCLLDHAK